MVEFNLSTIAKASANEEEAYKLIEAVRWANGVICPHCKSVDKSYFLQPKDGTRKTRTGKVTYRRLWKCGVCREQFSVLVGTVFEDSKIPLSKWLQAIREITSDKNGVSALELSRKLEIAYRSAWFLAHRIRYAMERQPLSGMLSGTVEADETYVGGKHKGKRGRGAAGKTPVVTLVERKGDARSQVMPRVTGKNVKKVLQENIDPQATLMTDAFPIYREPGKMFAAHETVDHGKEEYVRGAAHVNSAEGFFSQLKRSIDGTHHHVSARHLHRYLSEFDYRYNTRKWKDSERAVKAIQMLEGKRLMYREPTGKTKES